MNIMKNFLIQCTKVIAVTLIVGWGVSAIAWNAPTVQPPSTKNIVEAPYKLNDELFTDTASAVFAAINVGVFDQVKKGMLMIVPKQTGENSKGKFISPIAFFKNTTLPGNKTAIHVGGANAGNPNWGTNVPTNDRSMPLTLDTTGRTNNDAIKILSEALPGGQCVLYPNTIIETDTTGFRFTNGSGNTDVDILAKGIKITGGSPAKGKILISVDSNGNAVWATPKLNSNGEIVFDTTVSPVGMCQQPVSQGNQGTFEWRMSDWGQCVNGKQQQTGVCWDVTNNTQATDSSFCSGTAPIMERGCSDETQQSITCPAGQSGESGQCLCTTGNRTGQLPNSNVQVTGMITGAWEEGNPLVPYFAVLDELQRDGRPGIDCKVVQLDPVCNDYDFAEMNKRPTFTLDGDEFYQTTGGNSWEIDYRPGDQCIKNQNATAGQSVEYINIVHP